MVYLLTKICHSLLWIDCESLSKHAKLLPCNWCLRYQIAQLRNTFDFALKTRRWFGGKTSGNHHMVMKYWRDKDCLFSWRKLTPHRRQPKETNQKKNRDKHNILFIIKSRWALSLVDQTDSCHSNHAPCSHDSGHCVKIMCNKIYIDTSRCP